MADTTTESEERFAGMIRVGNRAVREAQARNRALGIPNWYLVGGRLVSDRPEDPGPETALPDENAPR